LLEGNALERNKRGDRAGFAKGKQEKVYRHKHSGTQLVVRANESDGGGRNEGKVTSCRKEEKTNWSYIKHSGKQVLPT